jgi:hypothetical protein
MRMRRIAIEILETIEDVMPGVNDIHIHLAMPMAWLKVRLLSCLPKP